MSALRLLAFVVSPFLALLAILAVLFRPFRRRKYGCPAVTLRGEVVRSGAEVFGFALRPEVQRGN